MVDLGAHDLDHPTYTRYVKGDSKAGADCFEAIVAAYYKESGFQALCEWTHRTFKPLLTVAKDAFIHL